MAEPIPDILVELLALGEIPDEEAAQLRAQLSAEGDPRLDSFARSDAEILARYPVDAIAPRLRAAALESTDARVVPIGARRRTRWIVGALAAAAAALLLWALGERDGPSPADDDDDRDLVAVADTRAPADDAGATGPGQVRHKGVARLLVHRQGQEEPLSAGATVRPGELLQLSYATGSQAHGVIVSLDGAGVATLHWPPLPSDPTALSPGVVRLDHAYELDEAPSFERFFFVTADDPIDPNAVLQAARALGRSDAPTTSALTLPEGTSQISLVLRKRG